MRITVVHQCGVTEWHNSVFQIAPKTAVLVIRHHSAAVTEMPLAVYAPGYWKWLSTEKDFPAIPKQA